MTCCCDVCQDHQLCSGLSPTAAAHIQEEIKAFLDLDFDSDDALGMLEASECDSRSVGAVCLPVACPESDAGSALELKRVGSGEVPGPIRFESSARVAKIRGQCRPRRRPSSEICLVKAFKHKCKGVRPLPVGTQDIDGEALDCVRPRMPWKTRAVASMLFGRRAKLKNLDMISFRYCRMAMCIRRPVRCVSVLAYRRLCLWQGMAKPSPRASLCGYGASDRLLLV